jgi:membrane protease YdiL (CAAX protease family)
VPWGIVALLIGLGLPALGLVLSAIEAVLGGAEQAPILTLAQQQRVVVTSMGMSLALVMLTVATVVLVNRATAADLGLSLRHFLGDLRLGAIAFVMLAPPVYAIQGLLVYLWKPSKHPLMEMFKSTPDTTFFVVLFVAAAVVAPLLEEVLFRVLLQGFLEKMVTVRATVQEWLLGSTSPPVATSPEVVWLNGGANASDGAAVSVVSESLAPPQLRGLAAWLPIVTSSVIFAGLHWSHGPDWVPLTLLAIGLGYLYQRTHRLLPCLVVHALLNSLSMGGLWIQTYIAPELAK